jgi:hypothetical protein
MRMGEKEDMKGLRNRWGEREVKGHRNRREERELK